MDLRDCGDLMPLHMPLVQALENYIQEAPEPFHMPGHKGGKGFLPAFSRQFIRMDATEIPGLDNLHEPQGAIAEAQSLAAAVFQSRHCFFLINGATAGIHGMIMAAAGAGETLLVPRNCHKSVWDALVFSGVKPIYLQPQYDKEIQLTGQIEVAVLRQALEANPKVQGMLLVHPNYYGMCTDIHTLSRLLKAHGKFLLVDEAHGAHLIFHPDLPPSSGEAGADLWVQSAHKTLPALTQTAYLQVGGEGVDSLRVARVLQMVQSTSPSYPLMASLDYARAYMAAKGKKQLNKLLRLLEDTRKKLRIMGFQLLEDYTCEGLYTTLDPTRLVIDVTNWGYTGFEAEELLRAEGVQVEMSDFRRVVLICTVADTKNSYDRLLKAFQGLTETGKRVIKMKYMSISREIPEQMLSPREAFQRPVERIPIHFAQGRISSGLVGAYPPGIPYFCPGELMSKSGIEELLAIKAWGGRLFGVDGDNMAAVVKD